VGAVDVRRSDRRGAVRPANMPWSTAALGAGAWRTVSSSTLAAHDGLVDAEVVEQPEHLLREERHP